MFESLGIIAIIVLIVVVSRLNKRLGALERDLRALRDQVPGLAAAHVSSPPDSGGTIKTETVRETPSEATPEGEPAGPWEAAARAGSQISPADTPEPVSAAVRQPVTAGRDIETALGTRWAVWVGGLALALGGLFLVRYSIEAGIFGPGVRLAMACLLGVALLAGGEFVRRTGFRVPARGAAGAYVPGILTAAGSFVLFGAVFAAHAVYGFVGPAFAYVGLGVIGVATIAAALAHGQALAGLGLLGALATPALISSDAPNAWALYGYLAVVLVANTVVARLRDWRFPAAGGFVGTGLWTLLYLGESGVPDFTVLMFISLATLGALAFAWLAPSREARGTDWPTIAPSIFLSLTALLLMVTPQFQAAGGVSHAAVLIFAMLLVAFYRARGLPLLHGAGIATVLVFAQAALTGTFRLNVSGGEFSLDGFTASPFASTLFPAGIVLALIFLVDGFWAAWRSVAASPARAAAWMAWAALVPLAVLLSLWVAFGNPDRDFAYAGAALVLAAILAAGGEILARREEPPLAGGPAVACALAGAAAAFLLVLHMAFGPLWTTMLAGAFAVAPAVATRCRAYPVLGWLCVGTLLVVVARLAFDPTIVGSAALGRTPVFNALLPGYGIPALAFAFAAWQLARTTGGRPRLAMEAGAAMLALLTLAMLVRHAMNGGVIDTSAPTLAEQAIYTLIALGAGAILISIDMRSPSAVLRIGSLAAGVVSVAFIVGQHLLVLNPVVTDEATGRIPVFMAFFALQPADGGAGEDAHAEIGQTLADMLTYGGCHDAAKQPVGRLDDGDVAAGGAQGGRNLQTDEPAAQHHHIGAGCAQLADEARIGHLAQGNDARQTGALDGQAARPRTRREDQPVEGKRGTPRKLEAATGEIDALDVQARTIIDRIAFINIHSPSGMPSDVSFA